MADSNSNETPELGRQCKQDSTDGKMGESSVQLLSGLSGEPIRGHVTQDRDQTKAVTRLLPNVI